MSETLVFGAAVRPLRGGKRWPPLLAGRSSGDRIVIDMTPMAFVSLNGDPATVGAGTRPAELFDARHAHDLPTRDGSWQPKWSSPTTASSSATSTVTTISRRP